LINLVFMLLKGGSEEDTCGAPLVRGRKEIVQAVMRLRAPYPVFRVVQVKTIEDVFAGFAEAVAAVLLASLLPRAERQQPPEANCCRQNGHCGKISRKEFAKFCSSGNVGREKSRL
jgi:hypothetical protein